MLFCRKNNEYCINPITKKKIGLIKRQVPVGGQNRLVDVVFQNRKHLHLQHIHQLKTRQLDYDPVQKNCQEIIFRKIMENPHPNLLNIFALSKKELVVEFIESPLMIYDQGDKKYEGCHFFLDQESSPTTLQRFQKELKCAVDHLHSLGIFHGDLEPNNILIGARGNLKLVDYGFSLLLNSTKMELEELEKLEQIWNHLEKKKR